MNTQTEQAVVGETPNLAARLQTMAEPGAVLICPSTRRLTAGNFHYRDLGPHHAERLGGADTGLSGGGDERRREPLRGNAQYQAAAAVRAWGGDRAAVTPLATSCTGGGPSGDAYGGAGYRQVTHCVRA